MENLKRLSEEFKLKYEKFLMGCDALEELDLWDKDKLGEMDLFYAGDLMSVILKLIAADGKVSDKETEYINNIFGFDYTENELSEIYNENSDSIEHIFSDEVANGFSYMKSINEKLAAAYKELLLLICDIVIESDGIIDSAETLLAARIKALNA